MGSSINKWESLNIFDVTPIIKSIKSVESSPMMFLLFFMFILSFIGLIFGLTMKNGSIEIEDESY